jgi:signal transduction histidine kinase
MWRGDGDDLGNEPLEAIGRLAGGIAHDFNNLLTGILGHAELLSGKLEPGSPLQHDVDEIRRSAERAAALTRQLLAFGQRQILRPQELDLNEIIGELEPTLGHLLGRKVQLVTSLDGELGRVHADRDQLRQVIVDLAVNARDAMPHGGAVTIETTNVDLARGTVAELPQLDTGPYVRLVVADTGEGVDDDVLAHIFEPFFTTKEHAEGLGLSAVYGVVKQSGGEIVASPLDGRGARFAIYLPRVR